MLTYVENSNYDNDDMKSGIVKTIMSQDQMSLFLPSKPMLFLIALIAFIITIGVLVTVHEFGHFVHEFGHFLIAKKFNIKVLRFSIGFGKILKSYKLGETIKLTVISTSKKLKTIDLQPRDDFLANPEQNIEAYLGFKFALPKLKAIINKVLPNSPAAIAGIQTGDEIIEVNNQKIDSWQTLVGLIKNNANQTMKLQIIRNQQKINLTLTPKTKAGISVLVPENYLKQWQVLTQKDFTQSFLAASIKTYKLSVLNLKIIQKMILGNISLSQISGPIGIANYAGKTAEIGVGAFLSFLAIVSIGLGLLNLLPIPLLDGGHLFFYLLEIIKGSPVSKTIQQAATKIGLFIILFLTIIAVYNDLLNLLFSP